MNKLPLHLPALPFQGAVKSTLPQTDSLNLLGIAFDGTACFRKGARKGPDAIRMVSADIETYSPYLNLDLQEIPPFHDLGNLAFEFSGEGQADWHSIRQSFAALNDFDRQSGSRPRFLGLGGEHSISYLFIEQQLQACPDLLLIHLDAHADLRDGYQGYPFSHASVIRRCLDLFGPDHQLVQFGIRSGTRQEYEWMQKNLTLFRKLSEILALLHDLPVERPVYLTLDLDYFDPSFMPGTGTPEPGGNDFQSFVELMRVLSGKNLVGADVVELAPSIDPTGNSEVFAAKVVRELILAMHGEAMDGC